MNEYNNINNVQNNNLNYETSTNLNNNYNTNLNNNLNNKNDSKKLISAIIIIVVIIVCGIGIGVGVYLLSNYWKENSESKICQNINLQVKNYEQDKISYKQFFELIKNDYDKNCNGESSKVCTLLEELYDTLDDDLKETELENCDSYDNSSFGKQMKEVCESINSEKERYLDINIDALKNRCLNVN